MFIIIINDYNENNYDSGFYQKRRVQTILPESLSNYFCIWMSLKLIFHFSLKCLFNLIRRKYSNGSLLRFLYFTLCLLYLFFMFSSSKIGRPAVAYYVPVKHAIYTDTCYLVIKRRGTWLSEDLFPLWSTWILLVSLPMVRYSTLYSSTLSYILRIRTTNNIS